MKRKLVFACFMCVVVMSPVHAQKAWAVIGEGGNLIKGHGIDASTVNKLSHSPGHYEMCTEDTTLTKPLPILATLGNTPHTQNIRYTQTGYSDNCFLIKIEDAVGTRDGIFTVAVLDLPAPPVDPIDPNAPTEIARITLSADARSLASHSGNVDPTFTGLPYETQYGNGFGKDAFKIRNLTALTPPYSNYSIESLAPGVGLHSDFFPTIYVGTEAGGTYWYLRCVDPNAQNITETGSGGVIDCPGGGTFRLIEN